MGPFRKPLYVRSPPVEILLSLRLLLSISQPEHMSSSVIVSQRSYISKTRLSKLTDQINHPDTHGKFVNSDWTVLVSLLTCIVCLVVVDITPALSWCSNFPASVIYCMFGKVTTVQEKSSTHERATEIEPSIKLANGFNEFTLQIPPKQKNYFSNYSMYRPANNVNMLAPLCLGMKPVSPYGKSAPAKFQQLPCLQ